jgi:hypothetical protein
MKRIIVVIFALCTTVVYGQRIGYGELNRSSYLLKTEFGVERVGEEIEEGDTITLISYSAKTSRWKASRLNVTGYIHDGKLVQSYNLLEIKKSLLDPEKNKYRFEKLEEEIKELKQSKIDDSIFLIEERNRLAEQKQLAEQKADETVSEYNVKASIAKPVQLTMTKEEKFIEENFPSIPVAQWYRGMRFINRYSWQVCSVNDVVERVVKCPQGRCIRTYVLFDCGGEISEREFNGAKLELTGKENVDLIYLDEVDKAKELLLDKTLYILTNIWLKESEDVKDGVYYSGGKQFIAVKIIKIGAGTEDGPVRMVFKTPEGKEYFLDVRFSNTNRGKYLGVFGCDFWNVFSFSNPKTTYPNISASHWKQIQDRKISVGMSEAAVRLSWGPPEKINRSSSGQEQWVYSGQYVYIKNKVVTAWN